MSDLHDSAPESVPETGTPDRPPRRRLRKRRVLGWMAGRLIRWTFGLVAFLVVALGATLWLSIGREVDAPDWLRAEITRRIDAAAPQIDVDFGRLSVMLQDESTARIVLRDVVLRNDLGVMVAELNDISVGVALVSLADREWQLRQAHVSGGHLTVQRDENGRLGLALGDAFAAGTAAPDIGQIIDTVDRLARDPRLAALNRFEAEALTIRVEDLRARRGWTADGGRVRLTRAEGALHLSADVSLLSGGSDVAAVEVTASSRIGSRALDFGLAFRDFTADDIASQSPALAWLEALEAPISGSLRSRLNEDGTLGVMNAALDIGRGVLQPNRGATPLHFDAARTAFSYDPALARLQFSDISVASPLLEVRARGTTQIVTRGNWPEALSAQFSLRDLRLAEGIAVDREIAVAGAELAFKLELNPFRVELGSLRITDADLPLRARGWFEAGPQGWEVSLDAFATRADVAQVRTYWPARLAPQTRTWVMRAVEAGVLGDVVFALRARQGEKVPHTTFDFGFEEARVAYVPALPPISGGAGRIMIHDGRLGLRLDRGTVDMGEAGVLRVDGSRFVIPDLKQQPPQGEATLTVQGPLAAALAFVDNDQWQVLRRNGRDAGIATGEVDLSGRLTLPLGDHITFGDIGLDFGGTLRDVRSAALVPGKVLSADRLDLALDGKGVALSGPVDLSGIAGDGRWSQPFDGRDAQVVSDVTVTPKALAALGITLPEGMLRGTGQAKLVLDLPRDGAPRFVVDSDLGGIGLAVPQIGWALSPQARGAFHVSGSLGATIKIDGFTLKGGGLDAAGTLRLTSGGFEALELSRLRVGDWMDVAGRLRGRGKAAPGVELASGRIDLRNAPIGPGTSGPGDGAGDGAGAPLALTLDSLRVTDSVDLRGFRGTFDTNGGLKGSFSASLGGETPVQGVVVQQNGGTAFRVTGEDAGDILKAANLLKTVKDGTFRLDLAAVKGAPGTYEGRAVIQGARYQKAPAIASLLDAISVVGIIDQMNGPGIFFSDIEARFRLSPQRVTVYESSAVGPSMGISLDGYYDLARGAMDFQGVISPIYVVNAIGRIFSRKGEGLIGFNFTLGGTVGQPKVSVNPLSALTPGMFRDIFRRPPPTRSQ